MKPDLLQTSNCTEEEQRYREVKGLAKDQGDGKAEMHSFDFTSVL